MYNTARAVNRRAIKFPDGKGLEAAFLEGDFRTANVRHIVGYIPEPENAPGWPDQKHPISERRHSPL